jgi:hypothetical protein
VRSASSGECGRIVVGEHRIDAPALLRRETGDQLAPQTPLRAITHAPDKALEHRHAGQQHLVGEEPVDRLFKERYGAILAHPTARVEPAGQTKVRAAVIQEFAKTIALPNQQQVTFAVARGEIALERDRGGQVQLPRHGVHAPRNVGRLIKERAETSGAAEHHRKP